MATPLSCPEPCPLIPQALVSAHPLHFTFTRKPQKPTLANLLRKGFSWKDNSSLDYQEAGEPGWEQAGTRG